MKKPLYTHYTALFFSAFTSVFLSLYQVASASTLVDRDTVLQQIQSDLVTEASIDTTEDNSTFETTNETSNFTAVQNDTTANITQQANVDANSGGNYSGRNVSFGGDAGMIYTSDAKANVTAAIIASQNGTTVTSEGDTPSTENLLNNTGDGTTTTQTSNSTKTTLINNTNQTVINQTTNAHANTGEDITERNISFGGSAGGIVTGNANTSVNYLVTTNNNATVMLVGGENDENGPGSGASIIMSNTGNNSTFSLRNQLQEALTITNTNAAQVTQTCGSVQSAQLTCTAITGGNTSRGSIAYHGDAGNITTGNAVVLINLTVDSRNLATTQTTTQTTNNAQVTQTVNAAADSGHNSTQRNISFGGNAGVIYTGNALVDVFMGVLSQ